MREDTAATGFQPQRVGLLLHTGALPVAKVVYLVDPEHQDRGLLGLCPA